MHGPVRLGDDHGAAIGGGAERSKVGRAGDPASRGGGSPTAGGWFRRRLLRACAGLAQAEIAMNVVTLDDRPGAGSRGQEMES
jgi:hypothetical protein